MFEGTLVIVGLQIMLASIICAHTATGKDARTCIINLSMLGFMVALVFLTGCQSGGELSREEIVGAFRERDQATYQIALAVKELRSISDRSGTTVDQFKCDRNECFKRVKPKD
jgi:hypothetical protein